MQWGEWLRRRAWQAARVRSFALACEGVKFVPSRTDAIGIFEAIRAVRAQQRNPHDSRDVGGYDCHVVLNATLRCLYVR